MDHRARGNPGRSYDSKVDLTDALKHHMDPNGAMIKIKNIHELINTKSTHTQEQLKALGWDDAYDLRAWIEFPDTERMSKKKLKFIIQAITGIDLGIGGGSGTRPHAFAQEVRERLASIPV
mmetsp:Transcript_9048/g.24441  ORF Transcript_9048/g.24441 Transcript_9048/m.24441 type:complete len:121 (-) Transcript_9048:124-486(-)